MEYTFAKLAQEVLETANNPLSVSEIWNTAIELGLVEKLSSSGKTPIRTLAAVISTNVNHNKNPIFKKVEEKPSKYILYNKSNKIEKREDKPVHKHSNFVERDLHILLSSFVRSNEHFKCFTKTIYHENSKKWKKGKTNGFIQT